MTCCVTFKVSGIRVIKGRQAKLGAFASVYNLASAIKYRGVSLAANCAINASQRSLNTTVSEALPSQLWLINGTPPSWAHHQFQYRLLQVRPVILGIAVGDRNGLGVGLRHIRPCEGKTGGVQTVERQRQSLPAGTRPARPR